MKIIRAIGQAIILWLSPHRPVLSRSWLSKWHCEMCIQCLALTMSFMSPLILERPVYSSTFIHRINTENIAK